MNSATDTDGVSGEREGSTSSVVERLADELESGAVPDADAERLRAALFESEAGVENGSGSLAARVEKLQRDVDEVLAYAGALEAFLDENGTGEQLIAETRDDVDDIRREVDDVRTELDRARGRADRAAAGVDGVEDALADVESELTRLDSEIESLQEWRAELVSVMSDPTVADEADEPGESE